MVIVAAEDVRGVLNISDSDISDAKVLKMIKWAEVTLELELNVEIDYVNCTDAQKEVITILVAIYALSYLVGGSGVGLNFQVGDLNTSHTITWFPLTWLRMRRLGRETSLLRTVRSFKRIFLMLLEKSWYQTQLLESLARNSSIISELQKKENFVRRTSIIGDIATDMGSTPIPSSKVPST